MKNIIKLIGITALVAVIGFSFSACNTEVEPAHVHQWGEWNITSPANCTVTGSQTRTCALDATHTQTEVIPVNDDHDWGEWTGTVTCTEAGTGTRVCSRSAAHTETSDSLQPLGHAYNDEDWGETVIPTCSAEGEEEANCVRYAECGYTGTRAVPVNPDAHHWGAWVETLAATETKDGEEKRTCAHNPAHFETNALAALNHSHVWGAWEVIRPPTCTVQGERERICTSNSNHKDYEDIDPTGHDAGAWHITLAATCTATGTRQLRCSLDNFVLETETIAIDPTAHDYGIWTTTAPTCTTAGIETRTCSHNPTHKETRNETPALGHAWEDVSDTATETADGHEGRVCNNDHAHDELTLTHATGTAGLVYEPIGTTAYRVRRGTTTGAIVIPAYHRPDADSPYLLVTEIGNGTNDQSNNAFGGQGSTNNTALTSVTFAPNSQLTTISGYAFYRCTTLTSVTIPASVTSIGQGAFLRCSALTSVTIPAGTIGSGAFQNCSNLESVTFGAGVTSIGESAFASCTSLTSVTIPTGTGQWAFNGCTGLTSVTFGAGVTSIGADAFQGCTNLASVTFEGTISSFNTSAFPSSLGDLRTKYLVAPPGGGPGTYTRTPPATTWTKE